MDKKTTTILMVAIAGIAALYLYNKNKASEETSGFSNGCGCEG
tara:strand:- start:1013 stop:1141 length:129 start_codon:yes stop_codon:yes gene_type:complete